MPTSAPIEYLDNPGPAEFRRRAAGTTPFVITHAADQWSAFARWTVPYLEARAGAAQVPVLTVPDGKPDGRFFYGSNATAMVKFASCLPLLEGARPRFYMAGVPVAAHLPMLAEDLGSLSFLDDLRQCQLWISGRNSKGPLHFDFDDNVHVVIAGRKRFFLFEYSQTPYLYPCPVFSATPHYSRVDPQEPDYDEFPQFAAARGYEVVLERGQMIFMPQGCWHQVVTEEPSIAINFWIGKRILQRSTFRALSALAPVRSMPTHAAR